MRWTIGRKVSIVGILLALTGLLMGVRARCNKAEVVLPISDYNGREVSKMILPSSGRDCEGAKMVSEAPG